MHTGSWFLSANRFFFQDAFLFLFLFILLLFGKFIAQAKAMVFPYNLNQTALTISILD